MIPTEMKDKLPKHLSYPLGAKAVSDALFGVPQLEQLRLSFHDRPVTSAVQFQRLLRAGGPFVVLRAEFDRWPVNRSASELLMDAGWYAKKWKVTVYPVLREQRHSARTALLQEALPTVKKWLSQPAASTWATGHRHLEFTFDPSTATLTPRESGEVLA